MGLFKPFWMRDNFSYSQYGRIESKIIKLAPEELAEAALNAPDCLVRRTAVENLSDQTVIASVAMKDSSFEIRETAVNKLDNQDVLAKIIKTDKAERVRMAALGRLTDQRLLFECAAYSHDSKLAETVIERLTDQSLLARFTEFENTDIRRLAVEKLDDQKILKQVAKNNKVFIIRKLALQKITDTAVKSSLLQKEISGYSAMIEKEKNIDTLTEIAKIMLELGSEEGIYALIKVMNSIPEGETRDTDALISAAALLKEHYKEKNNSITLNNKKWHYDIRDNTCPYEHTDKSAVIDFL